MAKIKAVGLTLAIASAYATSLPFTAASNAAETVLSMASTTGLAAGDYVEVTSAWSLLDQRVARVKSVVAGTSITLELIDTSDTSKFSGSGAGGVRKISTWTQITQLTSNLQTSGGEQQFADVTEISDLTQRQIPTTRSAVTMTAPVYFDPALSWVATVRSAADSGAAKGMLMVYPGGSRTVGNAYWGLREIPTIEDSTLRGEVTLSFASLPVVYPT
ncbi:MAG: phage tail tube protein [Rubrivivax sp.]